jgi:hypothetical protein
MAPTVRRVPLFGVLVFLVWMLGERATDSVPVLKSASLFS